MTTMQARPNKYAGRCADCGADVPAMVGRIEKREGKWAVLHVPPCPGTAEVAPVKRFDPTPEQAAAVAMFATGASMKIRAVAGAGKTATLRLIAESAPDKRIQYVAFNKKIAAEVQGTMPANVQANNVHVLAHRAIVRGTGFQKRLGAPRMASRDVARILGIVGPLRVSDEKVLAPERVAGIVMRSISKFCQTADVAPTRRHVPYQDGLDMPADDGSHTFTANRALAAAIEPYIVRAWADLTRVDGNLPFGHDHYLKMWQLSHPTLDADVILFDEAQDASPVMAAVVAEQAAQCVYVGDDYQAIYGFTGAVNALDAIDASHESCLTQSFRFGPAIAAAANEVLAQLDADLTVRGFDPIVSTVGPLDGEPDAILTRTNAAAVDAILAAQARGVRAHLVGGGEQVLSFARAAVDLQNGRSTQHPDLSCFDTWGAVQDYVQNDEQGDDLKLLTNLVDQYGAEVILDALGKMPTEANADLIVSTAHKAKGLEWDSVLLASDFARKPGKDGIVPEPTREELMLRYVATTRARLALDNSALVTPAPPADVAPIPAATAPALSSATPAVAADPIMPVAECRAHRATVDSSTIEITARHSATIAQDAAGGTDITPLAVPTPLRSRTILDTPATGAYLGTCPRRGCKAAARITPDARVLDFGRPLDAFGTPAGMLTLRELERRAILPHCATHRRPLRFAKVEGRFSEKFRCDPRCENARGTHCQCSCAGANHGAAHG